MMKAAAILLLAALAGSAPALGAGRYSYDTLAYGSDATGNVVVDSKTGLTWRRCSEGQTWDGVACAGVAGRFSHEAALSHAKAQAGWRLPNVKELASIVDRSRSNPATDATAFPGINSSGFWSYWSSSSYVGGSDSAWFIYFGNGVVGNYYRDFGSQVRLVRAISQ